MKQKFDLNELIDQLPAGLDRAVLRILSYHKGKSKAISRADLVTNLARMGFEVNERAARAMINQLRKQGYTICSTGGEGGGYFLADSWDELMDFIDRELHGRAMDLLEQEKSLKASGERMWGRYSPEKQKRLL